LPPAIDSGLLLAKLDPVIRLTGHEIVVVDFYIEADHLNASAEYVFVGCMHAPFIAVLTDCKNRTCKLRFNKYDLAPWFGHPALNTNNFNN